MISTSASSWVWGSARSLAATSGPIPDGSPRSSPMRGFLCPGICICRAHHEIRLVPDLHVQAGIERCAARMSQLEEILEREWTVRIFRRNFESDPELHIGDLVGFALIHAPIVDADQV